LNSLMNTVYSVYQYLALTSWFWPIAVLFAN